MTKLEEIIEGVISEEYQRWGLTTVSGNSDLVFSVCRRAMRKGLKFVLAETIFPKSPMYCWAEGIRQLITTLGDE